MGFGILFFGYFFAMVSFVGLYSVSRVLGGAVMTWAAVKLRRYHTSFNLLLWASLANILLSGIRSVSEVAVWISGAPLFSPTAQAVLNGLDIPVSFGLHICMLLGIRAIAKATDLPRLVFAAVRNMIFYGVLLALQLLSLLPHPILNNFSILALILSLVLAVMNLILIFRCYARICDESDVEMTQKPSRFAFVNQMRAEAEERRQRQEQEEAEAYRRKKEAKRRRKKNGSR